MTHPIQATAESIRNADAIVGIVVALPEELRTLSPEKIEQGQCRRFGKTWIAYSGTGIENAANAAKSLVENGAQILISWGCAAGLASELKPGDLVLAEQVLSERGQFETDLQWRSYIGQKLSSTLSVKNGRLFTNPKLVGLSLDKQRIRQSSLAVALDMESVAIAEVASQASVPFLVIRSIADPVDMDLPQAVLAGLNDKGQIELGKLLTYLLRHPWEVIGLIRLGLHFRAAQNTLKIAAKQLAILEALPFPIAN
ncbi:MAG: phosphorylase [Methylomonas sp.]|nr:phosphorylase [Methylomonas sp.]